MKNRSEPELSRPLRVEKISPNGVEETIIASVPERKALAERFDLIELTSLTAKLTVTPKEAGTAFAVTGTLTADVTQRCVATLEPLPTHIEQPINVFFVTPGLTDNDASERTMDEDDREPIENGIINLGELTAQHLGLSLNPYPRKSGIPPLEMEFGQPITETSPFAKLVVLKDKPER
jgi:uncharacterized metal-binding protein YceD (DUF177 family)